MPLTSIVLLFILGQFSRNNLTRRRATSLGIILLLLVSNPFFAGLAIKWWEVPPTPIAALDHYDVAVVLTGIADANKEPKDRTHFQKGADRLIHTIQLYKAGKIDRILISGGSGSLINPTLSESTGLKEVAIFSGVSAKDIYLDTEARNTYENAKYSKVILDSLKAKRILLVTSAFHMRRAQGCFVKQGVEFDVFSTDLYSGPMEWTPNSTIIPTTSAIQVWNVLIKEWAGILMYTIRGYI